MVPYTRRRLLHIALVGVSGLAGCGGLTDGTAQSTETVSENAGRPSNASNAETDPPTVLLRADAEIPPIRPPDFEEKREDSSQQEEYLHRITHDLIGSQSDADQITVTDNVDGDAVSTFIAQTDFSSETLYLETIRVQECYRLRLCYASWYPDKIKTDYVRNLRPYDERCSADDSVLESRLIRLPVSLDEDSVNSFATSVSGGGQCGRNHGPRAEGSSGSGVSTNSARALNGGETQ